MKKYMCNGKTDNGNGVSYCCYNSVTSPDDVEVINGVLHCHECGHDTPLKEAEEAYRKNANSGDETSHYNCLL